MKSDGAGANPRAKGAHLAARGRQIKQSCALGLCILAVSGAAAGQETAPLPPPGAGETAVSARFSAYYLGLKLMETELEALFREETYDARSFYRTGGIISWVKDERIRSEVTGRTDGARLSPLRSRHANLTSRTRRVVELEFKEDDVAATVTPPFGSLGDPPAEREDRAGAFDMVSGLMQIAMNINADPDWPCGRDVPIFDGKQRYDLRLAHRGADEVRVAGYSGPAILCDVYYIPVSGFDPEDVPAEKWLHTPVRVWFTDAPDHDHHLPVRFSYPVGIATLVIEARELNVQDGPPQAEHAAR